MRFFADLHIHSYYSRATSKKLNLEHLYQWGQIKGLQVIATGDITHPKWLEEMQSKLDDAGNGFFKLKKELSRPLKKSVPATCWSDPFFILSGEISCIYKKDKVRKVHHVVFFPSFESVKAFQTKLNRIGNIHSDGRPILGLDSRDLLELVLETDSRGYLIPAHIWTPWFSLLGSKSGFDTIEECFEDLSSHIFALETGLSSDPPMNWRLSMLDGLNLVSNSDAHSPEKLAREANIFDAELSYDGLFSALQDIQSSDFLGTVEFFPQEGKYHMDGHRKCNKMMFPDETMANNGLCPVCGKPAVLGVSYRVEELADRKEGEKPLTAKSFYSLIPLDEVISQVFNVGSKSKRVKGAYDSMVGELGSELTILMDLPIDEIKSKFNPVVAEAIHRMRSGKVDPVPGYDGEFGIIRIFNEQERHELYNQKSLFVFENKAADTKKPYSSKKPKKIRKRNKLEDSTDTSFELNGQQQQAVSHLGPPLIVQAGPGTGKTRTLTQHLVYLINSNQAMPEQILAITFTNKSTEEMRVRLEKAVGTIKVEKMHIHTFHAFGAKLLRSIDSFFGRNCDFIIVDPQQDMLLRHLIKERSRHRLTKTVMEKISWAKSQLYKPDNMPSSLLAEMPVNFLEIYKAYEATLKEQNALDYDDLIYYPVQILRNEPEVRRKWLNQLVVIAVDEFQDINCAQYELFKIFALSAQDVFVIGDPDQAIYGFRGASRTFFLSFTHDFPNAQTIHLSQNFRSAQNILSASVQMLRGEIDNRRLWSNIDPDVKCQIHKARTERAEAEFIVHQIERILGGTSHFSMDSKRVDDREGAEDLAFSDFAILLRSKNILPPILEALVRSGIPHETLTDQRLSRDSVIQQIIDSLRVALNHKSTSYLRLLQRFYAESGKGVSPREFSGQTEPPEDISEYLEFVNELQDLTDKTSVYDIIAFVAKRLHLNTEPSYKRLLALAQPYGKKLAGFLDFLLLQKEIDTYDERGDRVHLLTLHASKGLEFPVVFIPAIEDNILPYRQHTQPDIEEEKRLLYVGMTRAQKYLYLSHSDKRTLFGKTRQQTRSFLLESISQSLLQQQYMQKRTKQRVRDQLDLF